MSFGTYRYRFDWHEYLRYPGTRYGYSGLIIRYSY